MRGPHFHHPRPSWAVTDTCKALVHRRSRLGGLRNSRRRKRRVVDIHNGDQRQQVPDRQVFHGSRAVLQDVDECQQFRYAQIIDAQQLADDPEQTVLDTSSTPINRLTKVPGA